jgi:histidinol-phosphate aminotransferase
VTSFLRPQLREAPPYVPGEQLTGPIIKLNTNECPYPPSPAAIAAIEAASARLMRYPPPDADDARRALAKRMNVTEDEVFVANGSDETLRLCFQAYVDPGETVAWSTPTYTLYEVLANFAAARIVDVPRLESFEVDVDGLIAAQTKMTIVATPNSPTGMVTPVRDLERLAEGLERAGGLLVIDEAYADFAEVTAVSLIRRFSNVIVARTLSKSYALAGLRVGFALSSRGIISEFRLLKDSYNVGVLGNAGAAAALDDEAYAAELRRKVVATRRRLAERLGALGWRVYPSGANFLFAEPSNGNGQAIYERLRAAGIIVRWFGSDPRTARGVRITIGTDDEIDRFLEAVETNG